MTISFEQSPWPVRTVAEVSEVLDRMRRPINASERASRQGVYPYFGANGQVGTIDDYIFDEELVLVAEDGGFFFDPLKPIAYRVSGKSWVNNHAHVLRANHDMESDWIYFSLAHQDVSAFVKGATRPKLNQADLRELPVPCPSIDEQRRIVARIKACMERIDEINSLSSEAAVESEALRMAVLRDAVETLKARATDMELGSLVRVASGDFLPSSKMNSGGEYPVYGGNGITGHHDQYLFEEPVVVVGRVGAKCGCVHITHPKSWVTDNALYVRTQMAPFDQRYLAYMLEAVDLRQYARQAAQPVISGKAIYPVAIPYLDLDQQVVIADQIEAALSSVTALVSEQSHRHQEAAALRSAVLRKAFAGEL